VSADNPAATDDVTEPAVKLVATDLDGTLVRTDGTISERSRRALQATEASGRSVVFVTGRPPRWMHEVAEATGHTGLAICSNGALRYDLHTEQVVGGSPLDPATMAKVAARLRAAIPGLAFAVEYGDAFAHEPDYRHTYDLGVDAVVGQVDQIVELEAAKMLARHSELHPDDLLAQAVEAAGDLATFTHSASAADGLLEISAFGVTKASGLAELAGELGIGPEEVVAFGDMPNDLAMLEWAGHSVAVANAHPSVRAAADEITVSNDDDGVAVVLERLLAG
jgi:Cof subfamily protein (haloacid dehalogenase superfamily)